MSKDFNQIKVNLKTQFPVLDNVSKNIVMDSVSVGKKNVLIVSIDATHAGFVTHNDIYYLPEKMKKSGNSFITPYQKPVIFTHDDIKEKPIGRIFKQEYVSTFEHKTPANAFVEDKTAPKQTVNKDNTPSGFLRLYAYIPDKLAAEMILDGRLQTVSIKGYPKEAWCSICHASLIPDRGKGKDGEECEHVKGEIYDGQKCYYIVGEIDYSHLGFVNEPADSYGYISGIEFSETKTSQEENTDCVLRYFAQSGDSLTSITDSINFKTDELKMSEQTETPQNCPECDLGWDEKDTLTAEEQAEIDELMKDFDSELDKACTEVGEDAKLTTKKRESLPTSAFCGPNRSFPVPDCAHYTAALRLLGRYKGPGSKDKIKSCIERKGKKLGCKTSQNDETNDTNTTIKDNKVTDVDLNTIADQKKWAKDLQGLLDKIETLWNSITSEDNDRFMVIASLSRLIEKLNADDSLSYYKERLSKLSDSIVIMEKEEVEKSNTEKADKIAQLEKEITEAKEQIKSTYVERLMDLKSFHMSSDILSIVNLKDETEKETKLAELKTKLSERTLESLQDSIIDLKGIKILLASTEGLAPEGDSAPAEVNDTVNSPIVGIEDANASKKEEDGTETEVESEDPRKKDPIFKEFATDHSKK